MTVVPAWTPNPGWHTLPKGADQMIVSIRFRNGKELRGQRAGAYRWTKDDRRFPKNWGYDIESYLKEKDHG